MKQAALIAAIAIAAACSQRAEPPPSGAAAPAASSSAATAATTDGAARVVGKVQASGLAVIALEPKTARAFPPQDDKPVMDQVGLTFGPELLLVRTGEPVEFRNNDDTLHNVNVKDEQTREQAFNVAIPTGSAYEHTFRRDGFYRVGCDIHPAMAASIFAAERRAGHRRDDGRGRGVREPQASSLKPQASASSREPQASSLKPHSAPHSAFRIPHRIPQSAFRIPHCVAIAFASG
ncbi:MAG: hypothetical protein JF610_00530 [Acidobacteria bacterium]|nr:hypothetical protein [Acidobacteriota bacterium]